MIKRYTIVVEYKVRAEVPIDAPSLETAISTVQVNAGCDRTAGRMIAESWRVHRDETVQKNGWEGWWIEEAHVDLFDEKTLQVRLSLQHTNGETKELEAAIPPPCNSALVDVVAYFCSGERRSRDFVSIEANWRTPRPMRSYVHIDPRLGTLRTHSGQWVCFSAKQD